jgi:hypothetical protein
MEKFYPLHAFVCEQCKLVQLEEFESPADIFSDYAYFSSYSDSWLKHAENYVAMMVQRFGFNDKSQVIEIASNDGYLLQYFKQRGVPVLGVEPAANVAKVALEKRGIPSRVQFFGTETAKGLVADNIKADLLLGNNVQHQRLRRRNETAAQGRRRHHHGIPPPASVDAGKPVRHHLSRALQLSQLHHGRKSIRKGRA